MKETKAKAAPALTLTAIRAAVVPAGKDRIILWDPSLPGFGAAVFSTGKVTYLVQYRTRAGRSRRQNIGRSTVLALDEARRRARSILGQVADGADPRKEQTEERDAATLRARTLNEFWRDSFLPGRAGRWRDSTRREMIRTWEKNVEPTLGKMVLEDIAPGDVEVWLSRMSDRQGAANILLRLVRSVFRAAVDLEVLPKSPARSVKEFKRPPKERFLSPAEVQRLLEAIDVEERLGREGAKSMDRVGEAVKGVRGGKGKTEPESRGISREAGAILRILLWTGARRDEIRECRWEWLDWERAAIVVPELASKTGTRRIPLSAGAAALMADLWTGQGRPRTGWCFPGRDGHDKPVQDFRKAHRRVCKRAGIEGLRIHDLRHSAASLLIASGASLKVAGALLGHRDLRTTSRYSHVAEDVAAAAAERLAKAIQAAVDAGPTAKVLDIAASPDPADKQKLGGAKG